MKVILLVLRINDILTAMGVDEYLGYKRFDYEITAPRKPLPWGMLDFDAYEKHGDPLQHL